MDVTPDLRVDPRRVGLATLCGAIALALVLPLTWLVVEALAVDPTRARELVFRWRTLEVIANSLAVMVGVTLASMLIGVPLAYLTVRTDLPFRRFWTIAVALPLVVPSYIGAFAFVSAFGPYGEFRALLAPLGIERLPEVYGLGGTVFVITLYTYPYVFLTTRAALLAFDTRLFDAARTLDHGTFSAIRRVTLPQIYPGIAAGGLLCALYAVSDFGTPAIMRLPVFTREIYVEYHTFSAEYAALLSLQLLGIVLVVLGLEYMIRPDDAVQGDEAENASTRIGLGFWRWPATLLPLAVSATALVVPVWILLNWLRYTTPGSRSELAFELGHAVNSVTISAAAAIAAVLVALPIAYYAAISDSRLAVIFERSTYVGFAVPGVVLGLALVYLGSRYLSWVYPSLALLVFAYVIRFLPQVVGSTWTSLLQVDAGLVEAGRTLGARPRTVFRRITLPLIQPGVVAGAALVFLTTMKELPVTLILRPTGFDTIVIQIWNAQEAALYQYAAVPALLLVLISGFSMLVLLSQAGGTTRF